MLKDLHLMVHEEYAKGQFTFNKTKKRFWSLPVDQAHEQNNKLVKIEGGAVGILENHTSLMRWIVAGPEINKMLNAFDFLSSEVKDSHFEDNDSHKTDFRKDVLSFKRVLEDKGNPFLEKELIHIISKILVSEAAIQSVKNASSIGQQQ